VIVLFFACFFVPGLEKEGYLIKGVTTMLRTRSRKR
jgi:hypothetical protein